MSDWFPKPRLEDVVVPPFGTFADCLPAEVRDLFVSLIPVDLAEMAEWGWFDPGAHE